MILLYIYKLKRWVQAHLVSTGIKIAIDGLIDFFAHSDDETFGPGGTLVLLWKHTNAHLLFATRGKACREYPVSSTGRGV